MGSLVVAEGESSMRKKIVALVAAVALGTAMMSTGAMARGGHVGGAGGGGHFAGAGGHWSGGGRWAGGGGRWGGGWGPGVGLGIGLGLGLGGLYAYGGYPYGYCGSPYYYNSGYCAPYGYAW
jgi:hypothetical protein